MVALLFHYHQFNSLRQEENIPMKRLVVLVLLAMTCLAQDDADTYLKVEKARREVPEVLPKIRTSQ